MIPIDLHMLISRKMNANQRCTKNGFVYSQNYLVFSWPSTFNYPYQLSMRFRPGIGVSVVFVGPLEAAGGERDPGKMMQEMAPLGKKWMVTKYMP